ncbi:MAG: glutaminase A [Bradyrhizobiaceae bacterium]|nr:MAG: glutaminase A [Bradyrhizobiaceae bacterium]
MDPDMNKIERSPLPSTVAQQPADTSSPLLRFLDELHRNYAGETGGALADYIPELSKANPDHFGISLVSIDGHTYEVGDTQVPFTIQSISKAFVFALALDLVGPEVVEGKIGVEPSGEAFNAIRLNAQNRPFNAMVNAGAIACSGIIHEAKGEEAFETIRQAMSRFAGRDLDVDEAVFQSERATGDRNRAIGYLLKSSSVIGTDVSAVLDVYFRQCSILVNAHDIAVMGATLGNRGVNPITGEQVVAPYAVARALSVMTSSGMYDYAGEWIYRVGLPAKSGVGGGIVATFPSQFGLGTFSPLLDSHGNSTRGIKVCETLSDHFNLHMLNRTSNIQSCLFADYDLSKSSSRRSRRPDEAEILAERSDKVRVLELFGALAFTEVDYVTRKLAEGPAPHFMIVDFRRTSGITGAATKLMMDAFKTLSGRGVTVIVTAVDRKAAAFAEFRAAMKDSTFVRSFPLLDEAIEWSEDQIVYRYGGAVDFSQTVPLGEQALLKELTPEELSLVSALGETRNFDNGAHIIAAGETSDSLYFLLRGLVSVKLPTGVRLATLTSGMVFGELALLEPRRSADVFADTPIVCHVIPLAALHQFCGGNPKIETKIMLNLSRLLSARLIRANKKVDLLSAN